MTDYRYLKQDIERIISSGSVKQKAELFLRDRMGYFGQGFILTYEDIDRLVLSVEGERDRKRWEGFVSMGLRLENGFKDMNRSLVQIQQKRANLLRTLSEINDFENLELLMNRLIDPNDRNLWESVGDPDSPLSDLALTNLRERGIPNIGFRLISPTLDSSNHISFNLTGDKSLRKRAETERDLLRAEMGFYLRYEVAIEERISELKLDIPEYGSLLRKNRRVVEEPVSMSLRWEGVQDNRTYQIGEANLKDKQPQDYPFPSLMRMIEDYSVRPQDIDLNSDENQMKIRETYNQI